MDKCKSEWGCSNASSHDDLCCMHYELEYLDDGDQCLCKDDYVPAPFTLLKSLWN